MVELVKLDAGVSIGPSAPYIPSTATSIEQFNEEQGAIKIPDGKYTLPEPDIEDTEGMKIQELTKTALKNPTKPKKAPSWNPFSKKKKKSGFG